MSRKINKLGRSLIRDHKKKKCYVKDVEGFRHTSDLNDGLDWARLNLRSVTEQSSIDDFLGQAELAENEYLKEFADIKIVNPNVCTTLTHAEEKLVIAAHEMHKHILGVPRRPHWDVSTTKEELGAMERAEFLNWRRRLAVLGEKKFINLTPYEKNLEVWRQFWRVVEKSDVVVQIIDARNPLLFRSEDLETYVQEVDARKRNILLLNKADYLSEEQRKYWAVYFEKKGVATVFFSALQQNQKLSEIVEDEEGKDLGIEHDDEDEESEDLDLEHDDDSDCLPIEQPTKVIEVSKSIDHESELFCGSQTTPNNAKIYSREELITFFKNLGKVNENADFTTIGLVGYPNVGKSSTINAVMQDKKVQVSATPGKTKHFQTLLVDSQLCLCDCPGLVFPNFVSSKAEMIVNGILPIDHLTDHTAPISLVVNAVPREVLESTYSIRIQSRSEASESNRPTAEELLDGYGYMRGFMTQRGLPDHSRSARYILKDFVNGKLLYCHAPPDVDEDEYKKYNLYPVKRQSSVAPQVPKGSKYAGTKSEEVDRNFFRKTIGQAHIKGVKHLTGSADNSLAGNKPWKKHFNKNKKEKLRRIYSTSEY